MLTPPVDGVVFLLWIVALFVVMVAVTFLSSLALIFFFPPVVDRVYANDKLTTLRLDD
jgi:multisubunit Na+/H+ antiporter MnhF subunit